MTGASTPINININSNIPPTSTSTQLKALAVFCGSSFGNDPLFKHVANQVGKALANHNITLVYGGGTSGLMGTVAQAALDNGGTVHGVIPTAFLNSPRPLHPSSNVQRTIQPVHPDNAVDGDRNIQSPVESMHERKKKMADISNGFIALPGGYGTLEEIAEMTTWTQLGIHKKPVILLNVLSFYTPLEAFVSQAISSQFILPQNQSFMTFISPPAGVRDDEFDWGAAALDAVRDWRDRDAGVAFSLEWSGAGAGKLE
ncbi:hypothetical protein T439DRAFT_378519 [Meredithblackwellia eburnea MCA 4105]